MKEIPIPQADARLKEAMGQIVEILDRYGIGGSICLTSSTHAEYLLHLPEWSLIKKQADGSIRIKISAKNDSIELVEASTHLVYSQRDMNGLMYQTLSALCKQLSKNLDIEHTPFQGIPELRNEQPPDLKPAPIEVIDFLKPKNPDKKKKGFWNL
jgi:hypothetical protein